MAAQRFVSIADMKRQVTDSGSFWFSKGAMEWFGTRVLTLVQNRYLVTEETTRPEGGKFRFVYFERDSDDDRYSDVCSDFYDTHAEALAAAQAMDKTS